MRKLLIYILMMSFSYNSFSQKVNFFNINTSDFSNKIELKNDIVDIVGFPKHLTIQDRPYQSLNDQIGFTHEKYRLEYNQIPIEFSTIIVHRKENAIQSITGEYFEGLENLEVNPKFDNQKALEIVLKHINAEEYIWQTENKEKPNGEFVYIANYLDKKDDEIHLAYKYEITATRPYTSDIVYVSAISGEVLLVDALLKNANGTADTRYSGTQTISTELHTNNQYRLRDNTRGNGIETYNATLGTDFFDTDNNWTSSEYDNTNKDNAALDAHWGVMKTYDYFLNVHGRSSFDGNGYRIYNIVHNNSLGSDQAFWWGYNKTLNFGDGSNWDPVVSLDIVAHEFGHGLDQFSSNLIYQDESGALDESFGDIWGACVENFVDPNRDIWNIGEQIMSGQLRSMSNPNSENQPDTYEGTNWCDFNNYTLVCTYDDRGGVHTNSGVFNYWFYLLSVGGDDTNDNGDDYDVYGISISHSEKIAFRALTVYFTSNTNFMQARNLTIQAAIDLYGVCSQEVVSTTNAWHAVGVGNHFQKDYNLLISNYIQANTNEVFIAENNIEATNTIGSNSNVTFLAGNSIVLKPGFHTRNDFLARIQPCENIDFGDFSNKTKYETYIDSKNKIIVNSKMSIYPNPTNSKFVLDIGGPLVKGNISVYTMTGKKYLSKTLTNRKTTINIKHLNNGIYFIEVESNNNIQYFKIIKQ